MDIMIILESQTQPNPKLWLTKGTTIPLTISVYKKRENNKDENQQDKNILLSQPPNLTINSKINWQINENSSHPNPQLVKVILFQDRQG